MILTEDYIKRESLISEAVDFRILRPQIEYLESLKLDESLGVDMAEDIRTKFENQTLNTEESGLVELLKKMLVSFLEMYSADTLTRRIRNKGVQEETGNNSSVSDNYSIGQIKAQAEERAEYYKDKSIQYIEDNKSSFPLYKSSCSDSDPYVDVYFPDSDCDC